MTISWKVIFYKGVFMMKLAWQQSWLVYMIISKNITTKFWLCTYYLHARSHAINVCYRGVHDSCGHHCNYYDLLVTSGLQDFPTPWCLWPRSLSAWKRPGTPSVCVHPFQCRTTQLHRYKIFKYSSALAAMQRIETGP